MATNDPEINLLSVNISGTETSGDVFADSVVDDATVNAEMVTLAEGLAASTRINENEDSDGEGGINMVNDMVRFRRNPLQFLGTLRKYYRGIDWRAYDHYIGARIFYPQWQEVMLRDTLSRPVLRHCIDQLVQQRMDREESWTLAPSERAARRALYTCWVEGIARDVASKALPLFKSLRICRAFYYTVAQIMSRCYHQGVHVTEADVKRVRAKAMELQQKKQSLLLFPCHKSHIDYISLVFAFFRMGLSLPTTIAGENLNMAVMGDLLREVGALYIRRTNWSQDPLYCALFQAIIDAVLMRGMNLQCFIEGTRSRTGKLLPPKFGILKFLLETLLSGGVEDAWVLPISTQYDKVVEADTYATELLGKEKRKESFMSMLESSSVVSLRLGRVDIRFGEIWSLRSYIIEHLQLEHTVSFPLAHSLKSRDKNYLLRSLGYRILADINRTSVIMPSALVGTVLLTTSERGVSRPELIARVQWLIKRVIASGGRCGALQKRPADLVAEDIAAMVDNALSVLGPSLVECEEKKLLEPVYRPKDEFKLSYYRNQPAFLFVSEAIVCLALFTLTRERTTSTIEYEQLEQKVKFLSRLLSEEFVYKPEGLETNLAVTIDVLAKQHVISLSQDGRHVSLNREAIYGGIPTFDFYCYLVWPFIDGYWSVSMSLFALTPGSDVLESDFQKMAQVVARTLYAQGELSHSEALNKEVIRFAVGHFVSQGIVKRYRDEAAGATFIGLTPRYAVRCDENGQVLLEGPLYEFSEEIALSRSKTQRYGFTHAITDRMLKLCQPIAASLTGPKL